MLIIGIRPPAFLEGFPDHTFYPVLSLAICRELSKRDKLPQYNTIDDTVNLLKKSSNVIVLTGAGISTSLGIPDFRSKENGLYTQLAHLGLSDPQEVFDISLFREDPTIFYSVAKDILPSSKKFSPTHAFIKLLQDKNKLLTNFTQNIDNLESHAGILPEKLIQCHGSFASATCIECKAHVPGDAIYKDLKAGRVARCDECLRQIRSVQDGGKRKRKRPSPPVSGSKSRKKRRSSFSDTDSNEDDNIAVAGVMKPDITFFGEDLPKAFHHRLMDHDKDKVDLVLVIGTSLKVAPVSEVVGVLPKDVPQIYINRDPCGHVNFDVDILGECDTVVAELCRRAGWDLKHEMCTDDGIDVRLKEGAESQWHVRRVKSEDKVERQENGALGNGVNTEESSFLLSSDAGRGEVSVDSPASFGNSTFVAAGAGGTFYASRNTRRETNTKLDDDEPESDLIARQDVENGNTVFEGSGLQVEDEKDGTEYWFPLKAGSADREPKREASDSRLQ